jgi:hypothetical protein
MLSLKRTRDAPPPPGGGAAAEAGHPAAKKRALACMTGTTPCPHHDCSYHQWLATERYRLLAPADSPHSLGEAYRLLLIGTKHRKLAESTASTRIRLTSTAAFKLAFNTADSAAGVKLTDCQTAISTLARFLAVIAHLDTYKRANIPFATNDRMIRRLTACHLSIILGKDTARAHRAALIAFLDTGNHVGDPRQTIWITNRQQGKTSTLAKFIAAISMFSPNGGLLATVYSTGKNKAVDLLDAAKAYITWVVKDPDGAFPPLATVRFTRDNATSYVVKTTCGASNEVVARSGSVDGCRGDNPQCCFFDEAAFMSSAFWYQFAIPLLQVRERIFTATTTPPAKNSYFDLFCKEVKRDNEQGRYLFTLISHALACEDCIAKNTHDDCAHNLHLIPLWKSKMGIQQLASIMPQSKRAQFQAEVYGVLHTEEGYYFDIDLLNATANRPRPKAAALLDNTIYVTVDPASHTKSEMAIVATAIMVATGQTIILGLATLPVATNRVHDIKTAIRNFTTRLLTMLAYIKEERKFVFIVEVNNNTIIPQEMKLTFEAVIASAQNAAIIHPFVKANIATNIEEGIGVYTTRTNKFAGIIELQSSLVELRLVFAKNLVTITNHHRHNTSTLKAVSTRVDTPIATLIDQLGRIKDTPTATQSAAAADNVHKSPPTVISGKTSKGDVDDLAIALIISMYWSSAIRASHMYASMKRRLATTTS